MNVRMYACTLYDTCVHIRTYIHKLHTDIQTDRRTDGRTDRQTTYTCIHTCFVKFWFFVRFRLAVFDACFKVWACLEYD